jgi:hypothetical protein
MPDIGEGERPSIVAKMVEKTDIMMKRLEENNPDPDLIANVKEWLIEAIDEAGPVELRWMLGGMRVAIALREIA